MKVEIKDVISAVLQVKRNRKRFEYCACVREVMVVFEKGWELFRAEIIVAWQSPMLDQRIKVGV